MRQKILTAAVAFFVGAVGLFLTAYEVRAQSCTGTGSIQNTRYTPVLDAVLGCQCNPGPLASTGTCGFLGSSMCAGVPGCCAEVVYDNCTCNTSSCTEVCSPLRGPTTNGCVYNAAPTPGPGPTSPPGSTSHAAQHVAEADRLPRRDSGAQGDQAESPGRSVCLCRIRPTVER